MKKYLYFFLFIVILLPSCKKADNGDPDGWTPADEEFYNKVIDLQDLASENFETWILSMDSATALNQLQQFFLQNVAVSSATLGDQGIAVEYTNGMRGGIFINPMDDPDPGFLKANDFPKIPSPLKTPEALVNIKKAVFLNPSYWERSQYADWILQHYNYYMPWAGFTLQNAYKNQDASVSRFTGLAGYGVIHVYSHGWAYPKSSNISDVYLMTGEVASIAATLKYWPDIKKRMLIITKTKNASGWKNIYWINKDFIAGHNDFSQDTILFYGGFCYSFLGKWDQLNKNFAKGSYFGFSWYVRTNRNASWGASLVDSLCDTTRKPAYTTEKWISAPNPPKSYFEAAAQKTVRVQYVGDAALTFWQQPTAYFTWTASSMHSATEICRGSSVTVQDRSSGHGFPLTEWQWYFQNGTPSSYYGAQPPAIYFNTFGSGGVRLVVSNALGSNSSEVSFSIVNCK